MSERPVTERTNAAADQAVGAPSGTTSGARVIDWELARLKAVMPRVVSRTMSYSAMSRFDDALVASVQRFYGLDVDVATAETEVLEDDVERVRFFPWFLWDFAHVSGAPTVGARFAQDGDGELGEVERRVLRALCDTVVDFWEVTATDPQGIALVALGTGARLRVEDDVLGRELGIGQMLQGRVVVVPRADHDADAPLDEASGCALIDAVYAVLPASAKPMVMAELTAVLGPATELQTIRDALKAHAPELIDFAEFVLEQAAELAPATNGDGETIVLCSTLIPGERGLALEAALIRDGLPFRACRHAWVWRDERDAVIGFVSHDVERGRWVAGAGSRERLSKVTTRLAEAGIGTPAMHLEETLESAAEAWVETGLAGTHLSVDPEIRRAFEGWLAGRWVDQPHPRLGDVSPRQAARDESLRPAVEQMVSRLESLVGRALRAELGL